jgi:hypothetical protein
MIKWHRVENHPAPTDGRQILARNNRGNYAVVIWRDSSGAKGWVVMFSSIAPHPFWNGANGSVMTHWAEIDPPETA